MCKLIFLLISLFTYQYTFAQYTFQSEYIFLAPEKEICMPGDTLAISGQVLATNSEDFYPYSKYVYIECIDQKDSLLLRQKIACDEKGFFYSVIPTQLEWRSKICYLRAYTKLMQNYSEESFTIVPFLLGAVYPEKEEPAREIYNHFFPEGGRLIEGFQQNVVFHLTDDNNFSIMPARCLLLDEKNDTIIHSISVSMNGMGRFAFQPQKGKSYRLQVEYDNRLFTFPLLTEENGASLQAVINRDRLYCQILSNQDSNNLRLFLYHPNKGLLEIPFNAQKKAVVINLSEYPKGMIALFLMNTESHLLSERLLWYLPPEKSQNSLSCILPKTIFSPGEPLTYQMKIPDSSSFFIRIVQYDNLLATQAYPTLWMGNDILSFVGFPITNSQEQNELQTELTNWLYTAHFIRFSPERILTKGMLYPFPIEDGLFLSGTAWKTEKKPLQTGLLSIWNQKDLSYYSGEIDPEGHFIVPVDNYQDGTAFLLTVKNVRGKQQNCSFFLSQEIYPKICIPHPFSLPSNPHTNILWGDTSLRYSIDENHQKIYHINNVTVESRKPMNIREMNRNPNNFIGEDILIQRSGQSVRSLLNRFTAITVIKNGPGSGASGILKQQNAHRGDMKRGINKMVREYGETTITWKSGKYSFLSGTSTPLNVVVNGELIMGNIDYILEWPAGSLKSIELIKPTDSRCAVYGTPMGAILIETSSDPRTYNTEKPQGQIVFPPGLFISDRKPAKEIKAPAQPGKYRLLIDVVTKERDIVSFSREFEVR